MVTISEPNSSASINFTTTNSDATSIFKVVQSGQWGLYYKLYWSDNGALNYYRYITGNIRNVKLTIIYMSASNN